MVALNGDGGEQERPRLTDEEAGRLIRQMTRTAWDHSRPHPQEAEFEQMTSLFQERVYAFAHAFTVQLAERNIV